MSYPIYSQLSKMADEKVKKTSEVLGKFPKGPMGLTPDHISKTPEFKKANSDFNSAFNELRHYNGIINRNYKKEHAAAVKERRENRKPE